MNPEHHKAIEFMDLFRKTYSKLDWTIIDSSYSPPLNKLFSQYKEKLKGMI